MTSNGNDIFLTTEYHTNDGSVFNSYADALAYLLQESNKTSTVTTIEEFNEFYY